MTPRQAIAFVRRYGVVLEAAVGSVPSLAQAVAGEPIHGSWWAHACGRRIFTLTRAVRDSDEVLVCRAVCGKITYVHRRLWPALVRVAERFPHRHLARVQEVHTASGRHITRDVPFRKWVSPGILRAASRISEDAALSQLGPWCP